MYINMLNILENLPIFEWYFNYKNFILGIMSLVLSMILVASIFVYKQYYTFWTLLLQVFFGN